MFPLTNCSEPVAPAVATAIANVILLSLLLGASIPAADIAYLISSLGFLGDDIVILISPATSGNFAGGIPRRERARSST